VQFASSQPQEDMEVSLLDPVSYRAQ